MKIGNIIRNSELVNHVEVKYLNYLTVDDEIDWNLPTLIVGWQYLKEFIKIKPEIQKDLSILNKTIDPNKLYWEFAFSENKQEHVNGVEEFAINSAKFYFNKYDYQCIYPIFYDIYTVTDFTNYLPYSIDRVYNYKNEMIYFLYATDIFGIDLKSYKFYGLDIDTILKLLINKTKSFIPDIEGKLFQEQAKIFINFRELKRYIVAIVQ